MFVALHVAAATILAVVVTVNAAVAVTVTIAVDVVVGEAGVVESLVVLPHFDPLFKKLSWIKNSNTLPEKRDQEQNKIENERLHKEMS